MSDTDEFELYFSRDEDRHNRPHMMVHARQMPSRRAEFAMRMMEKFGLLLGEEVGEDSGGRQKCRRLSAKECASLACDTSDKLFNEMEAREWFTVVPSLEEMEETIKERENKKDNGGLLGRRK